MSIRPCNKYLELINAFFRKPGITYTLFREGRLLLYNYCNFVLLTFGGIGGTITRV